MLQPDLLQIIVIWVCFDNQVSRLTAEIHLFNFSFSFPFGKSALIDCLINPLQEQMEEWKKVANQLDKDHAKGTGHVIRCVAALREQPWDIAAAAWCLRWVSWCLQGPTCPCVSCRHFRVEDKDSEVIPWQDPVLGFGVKQQQWLADRSVA